MGTERMDNGAMATDPDCPDTPRTGSEPRTGPGTDPASAETDPSGVPFSELDPTILRTQRTSLKWTRFSADVLPLFVAEMDFTLSPQVQQAVISRVLASDTGYLDGPG